MIKSMTGYGRARGVYGNRDITVEIKAVNHRYFEMFARIPRTYMQLEDYIRNYLQQKIVRGKIEVNINIDDSATDIKTIKLNKQLFEQYYNALKEISRDYSLSLDTSASVALRFPDVIAASKDDANIEELWNDILPVLDEALKSFIAQRESEGSRLAADIKNKCVEIEEKAGYIELKIPQIIEDYTKKLRARIENLLDGVEVDEQRLLTEVAIMADKLAVDEEVVRLRSHCESLREMFTEGVSNGKKMDFIVQEMNREINTVSSKIGDIEITRQAIDVKNTIEKIREQIQNIE